MTTAATAVPIEMQRPWWLTLISGILVTIIGAILLWSPAKTKVDTYMLLVAFLGLCGWSRASSTS
jgi:uncharacterized membrane protein HdeD (DUF308 family)